MDLWEIIACVGVIVVGVAVIAYILLRTPAKPASFGDAPSIELGEEPTTDAEPAEEETEEAPAEPANEETAE